MISAYGLCPNNITNTIDENGTNCMCEHEKLLIKITNLDNKCVTEMNEYRKLIKYHILILKDQVNAYCKSKNISSKYKKMICLLMKRKGNLYT